MFKQAARNDKRVFDIFLICFFGVKICFMSNSLHSSSRLWSDQKREGNHNKDICGRGAPPSVCETDIVMLRIFSSIQVKNWIKIPTKQLL